MNSCLYECHLTHARFAPQTHRFAYRIFLFALDLDELNDVHQRLPLFSLNRPNLYSFRECDYLPSTGRLHNPTDSNPAPRSGNSHQPTTPPPNPSSSTVLKNRVVDYLRSHQLDLTGGRVVLVTLPRVFGTLFNPVSFYFCYDRSGAVVAALAEVTNTFREMKTYFLSPRRNGPASHFQLRVPKHFYVSPFSDVDVEFDFHLRAPSDRLSVGIDDYTHGERTFRSTLAGRRRELTGARVAWYAIKYPLITLRIVARIHWHALLLWGKSVPWFPKKARASEQRDLYRPHPSLSSVPVARR